MKKIAILGGTFNPVHLEHINLALNAVKELNLDKLFVMPTFISPHKKQTAVSAEHRLNMLKLAFANEDKIEVSDYEILKQGKSYTYLTVEHFKSKYDCKLYFICGADMLADFKTWKEPERILNACTLAVFRREDFLLDFEKEREYFSKTFNKSFTMLSYVGKADSSTKIREYLALGINAENLAPKLVLDYAIKNQLYTPDRYQQFIIDTLPTKRILHTANVVICALKLAKGLNLDADKVRLSATLHDCAKYLNPLDFKAFKLEKDMPKAVVHAFLGEYIASAVLGVTDLEVLNAIKYHTSGRANMSTLEKLIFVADMIEEGRDYDGVDQLRALYSVESFDECFKACLNEEMIHLKNKAVDIYNQTILAYNYYIEGKN